MVSRFLLRYRGIQICVTTSDDEEEEDIAAKKQDQSKEIKKPKTEDLLNDLFSQGKAMQELEEMLDNQQNDYQDDDDESF
jgi:hypothetical protein